MLPAHRNGPITTGTGSGNCKLAFCIATFFALTPPSGYSTMRDVRVGITHVVGSTD